MAETPSKNTRPQRSAAQRLRGGVAPANSVRAARTAAAREARRSRAQGEVSRNARTGAASAVAATETAASKQRQQVRRSGAPRTNRRAQDVVVPQRKKAKRRGLLGKTPQPVSRIERKGKALRAAVLKAAACILILVVCLFLAIAVGDSDYHATALGWAPLIACLSAILGAFIYIHVLARSLHLEEKTEVGECSRGDKVRFTVGFRNASPLFFTRIEAHFFVGDQFGGQVSHNTTTIVLSPFERYDMDFFARFDHIGLYSAGLDYLIITDFLRLFELRVEGPKRTVIQVAPRLATIEHLDFSNEAVMETTKAVRSVLADSNNYMGVRDYVKGDPLKKIHWKLSARKGEYLTRLYEAYTNPGVAILMDFFGPKAEPGQMMGIYDCVVETGLSVALYAKERGLDTEVCFTDRYGMLCRHSQISKRDVEGLVGEMPAYSADQRHAIDALDALEKLANARDGQGNLVVCTANVSADMISAIVNAQQRRRSPILFAVAPMGLEGKDRDRWAAPLARLDAAGIGYVVLTHSEELEGVRA